MCKVTSLSVSSWVLRAQQTAEVWDQPRMRGCRRARGRTWPRCCARSRCTDRARGCRRCRWTCWSSSPRTAPRWWTPGPGGGSSESCRQSPERPGAEASLSIPDPDDCNIHSWQPLCLLCPPACPWWQLTTDTVLSGGNSQWSAPAGCQTRMSRRYWRGSHSNASGNTSRTDL